MDFHSDICIIGNGAIGKAAALGFARAGLDVILLGPVRQEAMAGDAWDVRVYALNHVAHGLLSELRVWEAMDAARIAPVDAMQVMGDAGGKLAFDAYAARVASLAWIVEDSNLNRALDAALQFAAGVRRMAGNAAALQVDADVASVRLENGDVVHADLVVGADGGQSWVRGQCDIGFDYRAYGQRAVVANFSCEKPHRGKAWQWFTGEEGIVALLPLPGERVSLVWSAPDALADTLLAYDAEQLAAQVIRHSGAALGKLTPLPPAQAKAFPLTLLRPHAITAPRVVLVGDAAHVVHPLAGHGMNLGFADVASLVQIVGTREAHRDCGDARLLSRYARARKEDILLMQLTTDGLERLFSTAASPLQALRNAGLNVADRAPFFKSRLISHALGKPQ